MHSAGDDGSCESGDSVITVAGSNETRPLRVMFVIGALTRGGAERQMLNLAIRLRQSGHDVCIMLTRAAGDLDAEALAGGVELKYLYALKGPRALALIRLARTARTWGAEVVHPYLQRENALVTVVKPFLGGMKLVWGVRGSDADLTKYSRRTRMLWPFVVWASRFADLIIANSYAGAGYHIAAGYPEDKVIVIPNGIDTKRFCPDRELGVGLREELGVPGGVRLVGMLARFDPMKGHGGFLEVLRLVVDRVPEVFGLVVGRHSEEEGRWFRGLADELGVGDRVLLVGELDCPAAVLNALDVLVVPSLSEGFPNVVAEAMACGVPVAAYGVGDVERIVGGLLPVVECGDVEGLAEVVVELLGFDDGVSLRERIVSEYSLEQLGERTAQALQAE